MPDWADMADMQPFYDWVDLQRAVKDVDLARLSLRRVLERHSFPDLDRILKPDAALRDAVARLRTFEAEAIQLRDNGQSGQYGDD